jgi:hypothetical protein
VKILTPKRNIDILVDVDAANRQVREVALFARVLFLLCSRVVLTRSFLWESTEWENRRIWQKLRLGFFPTRRRFSSLRATHSEVEQSSSLQVKRNSNEKQCSHSVNSALSKLGCSSVSAGIRKRCCHDCSGWKMFSFGSVWLFNFFVALSTLFAKLPKMGKMLF